MRNPCRFDHLDLREGGGVRPAYRRIGAVGFDRQDMSLWIGQGKKPRGKAGIGARIDDKRHFPALQGRLINGADQFSLRKTV